MAKPSDGEAERLGDGASRANGDSASRRSERNAPSGSSPRRKAERLGDGDGEAEPTAGDGEAEPTEAGVQPSGTHASQRPAMAKPSQRKHPTDHQRPAQRNARQQTDVMFTFHIRPPFWGAVKS